MIVIEFFEKRKADTPKEVCNLGRFIVAFPLVEWCFDLLKRIELGTIVSSG